MNRLPLPDHDHAGPRSHQQKTGMTINGMTPTCEGAAHLVRHLPRTHQGPRIKRRRVPWKTSSLRHWFCKAENVWCGENVEFEVTLIFCTICIIGTPMGARRPAARRCDDLGSFSGENVHFELTVMFCTICIIGTPMCARRSSARRCDGLGSFLGSTDMGAR